MKKIIALLHISIFFALVACDKVKTTAPVVEAIPDTMSTMVMQIQKRARLNSTEARIHKIITHDDTKRFSGEVMKQKFSIDIPMSKRKIAIPMDATVKTYIDFSNFSKANIRRKGDMLEVILPDPRMELSSTRINHEDVRQYVSIIRSDFTDDELTSFYQQGRQAIIDDIPRMNLIDAARRNATSILVPMFVQMGFNPKNITITFRKKFSSADIPALIDNNTITNGRED